MTTIRRIPWNKGLTKETDERLAKLGGVSGMSRRGSKIKKPRSEEYRRKQSESHRGQVYLIEAGRKGGKARTGKKHFLSRRKAISLGMKRHAALETTVCRCMLHKRQYSTKLSALMILLFLSDFPTVVPEKQFGRFRVDAYLPPPYHLAFEADGNYWHLMRKEYDQRRDALLLMRYGLPVVRLTQSEIQSAERLVSGQKPVQ